MDKRREGGENGLLLIKGFPFLIKGFTLNKVCVCLRNRFSCVRFFVIPWTVAHQAPLSTGFSRQEYRSGLPCPSPGDLPDPGIQPVSPALAGRFFSTGATWEAWQKGLLLIKAENSVKPGTLFPLFGGFATFHKVLNWRERLALLHPGEKPGVWILPGHQELGAPGYASPQCNYPSLVSLNFSCAPGPPSPHGWPSSLQKVLPPQQPTWTP